MQCFTSCTTQFPKGKRGIVPPNVTERKKINNRRSRSQEGFDKLCRETKLNNANWNEKIYKTDKCFFKEGREPCPCGVSAFYVL